MLPIKGIISGSTLRIMPDRDKSVLLTRDPLGSFAARDAFFLPDPCDMRVLLGVVLSAQILAFVLTMVMSPADFWLQLSRVSLFVQAVALPACALFCVLRPVLARSPLPLASAAMLAMVGALAAAAAWVGQRLSGDAGSLPTDRHGQAVLQPALISVLLVGIVLRHLYVQHALARRLQDELGWRIDALQARIRPHFLFNCLNTITALVRSQPSVAEAALEDLADLFRASLAQSGRFVTLGEELALCRGYLDLERLRLGERLCIDWAVDAVPDNALLPALTLQPLLENAIYHGIEPCPGGGTIRVEGRLDRGTIALTLCNPQCASPSVGHGLALANTRQRLALSFGHHGRLDVRPSGARYEVALVFPYLTHAAGRGADVPWTS